MMKAAVDGFGGLDIMVNNAGLTRDPMLFNMREEEFDSVIAVHLRGHFLLSRNASSYWKGRAKETGELVGGSPGQPNYAAAKGGITALTLSTARGALPDRGPRERDLPPGPHRDDRGGLRRRRLGAGRRSVLTRARRTAGGLPGLARGRPRDRAIDGGVTATHAFGA